MTGQWDHRKVTVLLYARIIKIKAVWKVKLNRVCDFPGDYNLAVMSDQHTIYHILYKKCIIFKQQYTFFTCMLHLHVYLMKYITITLY